MAFRIIDYFMDKFLWAVIYTDPYDLEEELHSKKAIHSVQEFEDASNTKKIDMISQINEIVTQETDLKQERSMTLISIRISKPSIILKDRPYFDKYLEVSMSEVVISTREQLEIGRFHKQPDRPILTGTFVIDARDISISYMPAGFEVASPCSIHVEFTSLSYCPQLIKISSKELDKSYKVTVDIQPKLQLCFDQEVYTFILRCVDLNLAYTDNLESKYNFCNTEEYFNSSAYILKNAIYIHSRSLGLSIYESKDKLLTELLIKEPQVNIMMYLNN